MSAVLRDTTEAWQEIDVFPFVIKTRVKFQYNMAGDIMSLKDISQRCLQESGSMYKQETGEYHWDWTWEA